MATRLVVTASPRPITPTGAGVCLSSGLAAVAIAIGAATSISVMLLALLAGLCLRSAFPQTIAWFAVGIRFCSKTLVRIGVALLGLRVVAHDLWALGLSSIAIVLVSLAITLCGGYLLAKRARLPTDVAAIAATSVAICGASAALAASAAMPRRAGLDEQTSLIIIIVAVLSTVVMIVYP